MKEWRESKKERENIWKLRDNNKEEMEERKERQTEGI